MKTKEEIRKDPHKVIKKTHRYYDNFKLSIQIELTNQEQPLLLLPPKQGMRIEKDRTVHRYDKNGERFFNDLMAHFGKAYVLIPGPTKHIEFNNYEEFLDEITRD